MKKIIILGSSGSIGSYLCQKLSNHFKIIATVRKESDLEMINDKNNITALKVDFKKKKDIEQFISKLQDEKDLYGLINCYGVQHPIGKFKNVKFEEWENNIIINFNNFAFFLHKFLNLKNKVKKIIVFSGGGVTFPRKYFSAYAISKISLYKYVEILSEELNKDNIDLNLIAPGTIKSKMTKEVIDFGSSLGNEYDNSLKTVNDGGQSKKKIFDLCQLLLSEKSNGLSGRLFAAQWDNLEKYDMSQLIKDKNLFTMRRIDEKYFKEKDKS